MDFDKVIRKSKQGCFVRYGIIHGNSRIVLVKVGSDGSVRGREDKYLRIAQKLREKNGFTVICASNPSECDDSFIADKKVISQYVAERGFADFEVYLFGTSDGAYSNLYLAEAIPQTVKYVGVNTSTFGYREFEERLNSIPDVEKLLVYGTKDDEYSNVELLKASDVKNLKVMTKDGADHSFSGMTEEYMALYELVL